MKQSNGRLRNIVFDFGGVLVHFEPARFLAGRGDHVDDIDHIRRCVYDHADWQNFDCGRLSMETLAERAAPRLGWSQADTRRLLDETLDAIVPIEGMPAFAARLRDSGYDIYLLSNMPADFHPHFVENTPYWDIFTGEIVSGHVDLLKPDPAIYKALLDKYDLKAAETVFVDDRPENIEAARGLGMHGLLCDNPAQCRSDLTTLLEIQT
ncbi:MAG: HAD family hydrolase [Candidatus Sumerlaeota bacterium]